MSVTVAFDVLGTLFSLERLRTELRGLGAPDAALEVWFAQSLRDYIGLSHSGGYAPVKDVLEASLPRALRVFGVEADADTAADAAAQTSELDAAAGAEAACRRLREVGCRLVALSNGSPEATRALLERAGLDAFFDRVLSSDDVGVSKPAAAPYELVLEFAHGESWLVAAHAWDIAGATRAGMRTVWVGGLEGEYLAVLPRPDVEVVDLRSAAEAVAERVADPTSGGG